MSGGFNANSIKISQTSTQYLGIPVKALTLNGISYNPIADAVYMAFLPQATQTPTNTDWKIASWSAVPGNILYPYAAYCLIGPVGTVTLTVGNYVIYLKITDNPEIPVQRSQTQLQIY